MASRFDANTFWDEVRRYGVTVASYTWTMLRELVDAPPHPGERHHPVRLFIGSGMPRGLWRRVEERCAPARVLEFYASTEAGAILVNLRAAKRGSMGRPLPGSAEVRIAAYDIGEDKLLLDDDGFARQRPPERVGRLLVRVEPGEPLSAAPLRGIFSVEDAWVETDDLFMRDRDGDYWRIDGVRDVIRGAERPIFTTPIRDALMDLPAVDLAVAYGVAPREGAPEIAVAAVTRRGDRELTGRDLAGALADLSPEEWPTVVHVVDEIPITTWYRPMTGPLRAAGIPEPRQGGLTFIREGGATTYRALSAAARRRLLGQAPARRRTAETRERANA
jgi:putative long chain acyl-CoA synthase